MKFSPPRRALEAIGDQRIDIWLRPLLSAEQPLPRGLVHPDEWRRCLAMGSQLQRDKFVTGRALSRTVLSSVVGEPPERLAFTQVENGKLELDGHPWLSHNLSFASGFAALALTSGARLGIDIEADAQDFGLDTVARRFFSPTELSVLCATPGTLQCRRFVEIWTLKEAYIKATGQGFFTELDRLSFAINKAGCISYSLEASSGTTWSFAQFEFLPGLLGAICVEVPSMSYCNVRIWLLAEDGSARGITPIRRCKSQAIGAPLEEV